MNNIDLAMKVLVACAELGVEELILCAGARNAPFVTLLAKAHGVRTYSFFEERSAGFFALGRMQASLRPVVVITTSGTAAAELLPAVIEADYQRHPLIVITADRPRRYRGSGAPQTIDQPGIYSHYVAKCLDIESEFTEPLPETNQRPLHLNVCFDEPLLAGDLRPWAWPKKVSRTFSEKVRLTFSESWPEIREPLVLIGGLSPQDPARLHEVRDVVQDWQRPVLAEGISQLRGQFETSILESELASLKYDGVIRIGSVPTLRLWRDLENCEVPVVHFSDLPWSGLPRSPEVHPIETLRAFGQKNIFQKWSKFENSDRALKLDALLKRFPQSEPGWVRWLSQQMKGEAQVFLGNSLPIRDWDLAADERVTSQLKIFANRGVNGIDGLLSTFFGVCEERTANWALLGDLSALYDLSSPWALQQRPIDTVNVVILNNGGGKIFKRIFNQALFENRHELGFSKWAEMWDLDYLRLESEPTTPLDPARKARVIEIIPSEEQTTRFWEEFK